MLHKGLILVILLSLLAGLAFAEMQQPGYQPRAISLPNGVEISRDRTAPEYIFTKTPTSLMTSYYDYMPGSYNGLPLRVIPESAGGGYLMTYHGTTSATATRRVYYAYLDASGNVIVTPTISLVNRREGYPTLAVDPVSGKPMYAWHTNADTDALLETMFVYDAFIGGIDGLFSDYQIAINNPWTINATTDNEFIWPTAIIGPSPVANKRRVFIASRNSVTHANTPSENVLIAYADFSTADLENDVPLVFSHTSIPTLNDWNADMTNDRRPNYALACDNAGNLYYYGYHTALDATDLPINEPDIDVFKCPAYGSGTWTRYSFSSTLSSWNPPAYPGGPGFFVDDNNVPYTNDQLKWKIVNSPHNNATVDSNGRLHFPALWGFTTPSGSYYSNLQFVKEVVFDTFTNEFHFEEVYPENDPTNSFSPWYQPWDTVAPWGVVDEYLTDATGNPYPAMATDWNFSYWNENSHDSAMMYHCSNMKITESNEQGMLAMVWQNSQRAKKYNQDADPAYTAYANTPEIFISVSPDNGGSWLEPIILNNVITPQFAGLKPMWVYPADKIKYVGMQGCNKVGKLGLMFYNDNTWGSNVIAPTEFPLDGGQVMFTEIQIVFSEGQTTNVAMPTYSPPGGTYSSALNVTINCSTPGAQIYYTTDGWEPTSGSTLYSAPIPITTTTTLKAKAYAAGLTPSTTAHATYTITNVTDPWGDPAVLTGSMTVMAQVTINALPATGSDVLAAFVNVSGVDQLRGKGAIVVVQGVPGCLLQVYTETSGEQVMFKVWDFSAQTMVPVSQTLTSEVGGMVGSYPGDLYQINASANPQVVAMPTFTPAAGTYATAQNVSITCSTAGAQIHYRMDGMEPTINSPMYSEPINLPLGSSYTIKAKAFLSGWTPSVTATAAYVIPGTVATPTFSPYAGGTYSHAQNVTITCTTAGAQIRYTTDGTEPTESSTLYSTQINVAVSVTIKAKGFLTDWAPSATATAIFTITGIIAMPTFSPVPGNYENQVDVILTCASPYAYIRYTLDGTEPGNTSQMYGLPIHLTQTTTIRAKGFLPSWSPSETAVGLYDISVANPEDPNVPVVTGISDIYPNPFSTGTTIKLGVKEANQGYQLKIYNIKGECVYRNDGNAKGSFELKWNGQSNAGQKLASGIYLISFTSGSTTQTRKVVIK